MRSRMRTAPIVVLAFLLLASCSGDASSPDSGGDVLSLPDDGKSKAGHVKKEEPGSKKDAKDGRGSKDGGDRDATGSGSDQSPDEDGDGSSGKAGGSAAASSLPLPTAGSYSFVQGGWEELCQASNCDRSDLPPSQSLDISYSKKTPTRAVFLSKTEGSGSRSQTITYDVRSDEALITKLESTFSSGAFSFKAEIVPSPPVQAGAFPLTVGETWSGRWDDRNDNIDGSYRFDVVGRDRMSIDGKPEEVVVVDTSMVLSGDYRGTNEMRLWVIPDEFTIVASKGFTEIESQYGTYRSRFTTSYRSGP
jgi:hypothetical protein